MQNFGYNQGYAINKTGNEKNMLGIGAMFNKVVREALPIRQFDQRSITGGKCSKQRDQQVMKWGPDYAFSRKREARSQFG